MKSIDEQLYGLEAELDTSTETDGTTCFCVDKGTVYVSLGGIWYEQDGAYWKVGGASDDDLSGYTRYMPSAVGQTDLTCFNAVDTGARYVAYCGHWFKQPIPWADNAVILAAEAQPLENITPGDISWDDTTLYSDGTIGAELQDAEEDIADVANDLANLTADGVAYDPEDEYTAGSVGAALSDVKSHFEDVEAKVFPVENLIPFAYMQTGSYIQKTGYISNSENWTAYWFHASDIQSISKIKTYSTGNTYGQIAFYNSSETVDNTTLISRVLFDSGTGATTTENVTIPDGTVTIVIANRASTGTDVEITGTVSIPVCELPEDPWKKYDNKFLLIGYSYVTNPHNYEMNTAELFSYVGENGYDAIKGDIQITSDDELVMCHNPGFTLDGDGEITNYDSQNSTAIRSMTLAQVKELVFARKTDGGDDMHVPTFEEYVRICKKYGKVCFITIRTDYLSTIVPLVLSILDKYKIRDNAIINSRTSSSIATLREYDKKIPAVYTIDAFSSGKITAAVVRTVGELGNCALGYFVQNGTMSVAEIETILTADATNINRCFKFGIRIIGAIITEDNLQPLLNAGFSGAQSKDPWPSL